MTIRELIQVADRYPIVLAAAFALPLVLTWVCGQLHGKGRGGTSPWKYLYSVLIYAVCVPGLLSGVVTAYTLFFTRENLLDASLIVYFVPVVAMVVTLVLIRKNVSFDDVPGFGRLSGLMVMIGCSFALALAIDKTHIWIWFGASIERLFLLALAIFALLRWGTYMLFRRRDEPKRNVPGLRMK
jgi:hypothetical protein